MALFRGAGVALVTPFHEDESIDYEALERLIEEQIAGHTDAIIVCGTTGEPATMTEEERISCIRFVTEKVNHRVPVIAGTGCNCTRNVIDFSKKVESLGVDGLLVVTPYYNKATQEGLYQHYMAVAKAVALPIIMYNVPSRTGCNLLPETAARIGRDAKNIVAIKEASGNIAQVAALASLCKGVLDIYSGNDDEVIPVLALGGIGVISVMSNVAPEAVHEMAMEYLEGDQKRALDLQLKSLPLIHALFSEVNPIPVKAALAMQGKCKEKVRLPLTEFSESKRPALKRTLEDFFESCF